MIRIALWVLALLVTMAPVASADPDDPPAPPVNQQWGPGNPDYDFCASMGTPWPNCWDYGTGGGIHGPDGE